MDHFSITHKLSLAELSALRLDGEVNSENLLWDMPQSWAERSARVLGNEKHPLVLTGLSAVWSLIGCSDEPRRHSASIVSASRIRVPISSGILIEERTLSSCDYWISGKVGVTTPLRTITDVLRMDFLEEVQALNVVQAVMNFFCIEIPEIREALLKMTSVPHKRMALTRMEKLVN
jgi:hypothetical protein